MIERPWNTRKYHHCDKWVTMYNSTYGTWKGQIMTSKVHECPAAQKKYSLHQDIKNGQNINRVAFNLQFLFLSKNKRWTTQAPGKLRNKARGWISKTQHLRHQILHPASWSKRSVSPAGLYIFFEGRDHNSCTLAYPVALSSMPDTKYLFSKYLLNWEQLNHSLALKNDMS